MIPCCFFFFKQKTAYEMRISDWSSDVCSSDLGLGRIKEAAGVHQHHIGLVVIGRQRIAVCPQFGENPFGIDQCLGAAERNHAHLGRIGKLLFHEPGAPDRRSRAIWRSEEHTSELQSLMRISYAVFCLKKKTI